MKVFVLGFLLLFVNASSRHIPDVLFKKWVHSVEEDSAGVEVYRPATYDFPVLRGRLGFEIKKNGEIVYTTIGRDDRLVPNTAYWKALSRNQIQIFAHDHVYDTLTVLSVSDDWLKVKRIKFLYRNGK